MSEKIGNWQTFGTEWNGTKLVIDADWGRRLCGSGQGWRHPKELRPDARRNVNSRGGKEGSPAPDS